jgi:hypothetical protein
MRWILYKELCSAAYNNSSTTLVYNKASWCEHEYVEVCYLQTQNTLTHQSGLILLNTVLPINNIKTSSEQYIIVETDDLSVLECDSATLGK